MQQNNDTVSAYSFETIFITMQMGLPMAWTYNTSTVMYNPKVDQD